MFCGAWIGATGVAFDGPARETTDDMLCGDEEPAWSSPEKSVRKRRRETTSGCKRSCFPSNSIAPRGNGAANGGCSGVLRCGCHQGAGTNRRPAKRDAGDLPRTGDCGPECTEMENPEAFDDPPSVERAKQAMLEKGNALEKTLLEEFLNMLSREQTGEI